ncbi:MAG: hypothetical protein BEN18_10775 [Epulopiscium sp. Nuni2H_MBin001]|nr:MAG: hypothetical protein BEN18_10775 [Epulopiscium sp. Nuni2H_MBin001]
MKKLLLTALAFGLFTELTFANAAAYQLSAYQNYEVYLVDEDCPIQVLDEHLVFDFSGEHRFEATATYQMYNPTNEVLEVNMMFPAIINVRRYLENQDHSVEILVNKEPIAIDLYLGDKMQNTREIDYWEYRMENILKMISRERQFVDSTYIHYSVENDMENDMEEMYITIKFANEEEYVHLIADYATTAYVGDDGVTIILHIYDNEDINFFAAQQLDNIQVTNKSGEDITHLITQVPVSYRDILVEQIYNLAQIEVSDQLLEELLFLTSQSNEYYFDESNYMSTLQDRIVVFDYQVSFEPLETVEVSVRYPITLGKNTINSYSVYNIIYFLEPATHWAQFGNLNIDVLVNPAMPYIIDSNIEFNRLSNGNYNYSGSGLPADMLVFTLFEQEDIPDLPEIVYRMTSNSYFRWVIYGLICAIILICLLLYSRKKFNN